MICEDTLFTPWESDFEVQASKKVMAEVLTQEDKITINEGDVKVVNIKQEGVDSDLDHATNIINLLVMENITIENLHLKKKEIGDIISTYQSHKSFPEDKYSNIIDLVVEGLK